MNTILFLLTFLFIIFSILGYGILFSQFINLKYKKKNIQDDVIIYIINKEMCWETLPPCLPRNINVKK